MAADGDGQVNPVVAARETGERQEENISMEQRMNGEEAEMLR